MCSLATTVAGIAMPCCIYNASGPKTQSIEALEKIGASQAGAILSKSTTLVKQTGNPLPRFIQKIDLGSATCEGSINSEGLPNEGIDYFIEASGVKSLSSFGKPYIVSLSGLSLGDNLEMLSRVLKVESGIAAIELNLACPNIPGKPVIAYDFDQMDDVLKQMTSHPDIQSGDKILGVKLAPYFDRPHVERAVSIIIKYRVRYIVSINTIGNALFVDADTECASIAPKGGFGGLGGGFVKHTALANVRMLTTILEEKGRSNVDVVGVGGVSSGTDAFELILCGARAVQVGTCHWNEGAPCFARIASELEAIMRRKGYSSIEDFRGKLKPYERHASKVAVKGKATGKPDKAQSSSSLTTILSAVIVALLVVVALLLVERQKHVV